MMTTEISTAREQQLFNGKNFHVVIYNKTESVSGLHQHDYYEFTVVLTGRYYREINGKRVLLERGDFVFIPMGSHHQSFYEFGATRILNVGISRRFFENTTCRCCRLVWWLRKSTPCRALFSATLSRSSPHSIFAKRNLTNLSSWSPFMSLTVYATIVKSRLPT